MKVKVRNKTVDEYELPTDLTVPCANILDYSFLFYGAKGIGKTTLSGRFPRAVHFMFEPGSLALKIYKLPVKGNCFTDWQDVRGYLRTMKKKCKTSKAYRTAVWDTGNKAYDLHMAWAVKTLLDGVHPGKVKDFGASWRIVHDSFEDAHLQIASMGMGFVCIAHEKFKDIEVDGRMCVRAEPRFSSGPSEFYEGVIDVIGHYHYEGDKRYLQIRGDQFTVAKCRIEGRFLTPRGAEIWEELDELVAEDTGKLPDNRLLEKNERIDELSDELEEHYIYRVPMGNSSAQAYRNLIKAFNNEQTETFKPRKETSETSGSVKKKKKKKFVVKKRS